MNMFFEHIGFINFLWIIVVLTALYFISAASLSKYRLQGTDVVQTRQTAFGARFLKFIILLVAVAALIFALAGPYINVKQKSEKKASQVELVFAVDVSKSMLAADVFPDRLTGAKHFISDFIKQAHGEKVGIVLFAGKANAYVPLTSDYNFLNGAVESIANQLIVQQGTSLNQALRISRSFFEPGSKDLKVLCIISDGEAHQSDYSGLSDTIRKSGISLFAFGVGTDKGANIFEKDTHGKEIIKLDEHGVPIISRLHEESLKRIVGEQTDRYFKLSDSQPGIDFLKGQLESLQVKSPTDSYSPRSYFKIFLLFALLLITAEIFINNSFSLYQKAKPQQDGSN